MVSCESVPFTKDISSYFQGCYHPNTSLESTSNPRDFLPLELTIALCYPLLPLFCALQNNPDFRGHLRSCGLPCFPSCNELEWAAACAFLSTENNMIDLLFIHFRPCAAHCKAQRASRVAVLALRGKLLGVPIPHCGHQPLLLRSSLLVHGAPKPLQLGDWLPKGSTSKLVPREILVAFLEMSLLLFYPKSDVDEKR